MITFKELMKKVQKPIKTRKQKKTNEKKLPNVKQSGHIDKRELLSVDLSVTTWTRLIRIMQLLSVSLKSTRF